MVSDVFVDTAFFKALVDIKDEFYSQAQRIWGEIKQQKPNLVTTNYILDESYTLIRKRCGVKMVYELRKMLGAGGGKVRIYRILVRDEKTSWRWFEENWSGLSFTDCTSFAVMQRLGIKRVATFDEHFRMAGFEILGR